MHTKPNETEQATELKKAELQKIESQHIVFFDGVCGLCNKFVDFLLRHDRDKALLFAPLQGETSSKLLPKEFRDKLDSVAFTNGGKTWTHSSAVVRILWQLGPFWKLCAMLMWLVPKPLRNIGYRSVANARYRLFGKTESCRMPQPGEQARFLD